MRIIRDGATAAPVERGATVALGNFDGVHRGHQTVLAAAQAARPDAALGVVTFAPHPRRFFQPTTPPFELMSPDAKAHRLEKLGVSRLYLLPFDGALAALTPVAFCERVLVDQLGVAHVTVGADFCFGARRAGNAATLRAEGARLGFGVTVAPLLRNDVVEISSTAIRTALVEGRPDLAAAMLGHWHRIEAVVEHGEKRGRTLGYPTANLPIEGILVPRLGVYAVKVDVLDGAHPRSYEGVASLGVRPMFGDNRPNLEVHLFDFAGDLYGARLSVALVAWQRPELRFDGIPALVAQMAEDSLEARRRLRDAVA